MRRLIAILLALFFAVSCEAPWDAWPSDNAPPGDSLWITGIIVAGHPFDSIRVEGQSSIQNSYDFASQPASIEGSSLRIERLDSAETVEYLPSASQGTRVWVARDPSHRVAYGARYRLVGDFLRAGRIRHIEAVTYTSAVYGLGDSIAAPMEALHPHMGAGFSADSLAALQGDEAFRRKVWDEEINAGGRCARHGLTIDSFRNELDGKPVYWAMRRGDTIWSINDKSKVLGLSFGKIVSVATIQRNNRQLLLRQKLPSDPGGFLYGMVRDTSGAVIRDQASNPGPGGANERKVKDRADSADLFPASVYRVLALLANADPSQPWFPKVLVLTAGTFTYTGDVALVGYAVDSALVAYNNSLSGTAAQIRTNFGGGGPGSILSATGGDGQNFYSTNVRGGLGVFVGAVRDSFPIHFESSIRDTFPIQALRAAFCAENRGNPPKIQMTPSQFARLCP